MDTNRLKTIRLSGLDNRLARVVFRSQRLAALLPQDEVEELLTAHEAAAATVEAARTLPVDDLDVFGLLDGTFRKGKAADPTALIKKLSAASEARTQRDRVLHELTVIQDRHAAELVRVVHSSVDGFYSKLQEQLDAILAEGEELLHELGTVSNADEAIDAGLTEQWPRFKALGKDYADLRARHLDLARAADGSAFVAGEPAIGFLYFANLDEAEPLYARVRTQGAAPNLLGVQVGEGLSFPVDDPQDPAHWRYVVAHRGQLEPYVGFPDEALSYRGVAVARMRGEEPTQPRELGKMASFYGGEKGLAERYLNT